MKKHLLLVLGICLLAAPWAVGIINDPGIFIEYLKAIWIITWTCACFAGGPICIFLWYVGRKE